MSVVIVRGSAESWAEAALEHVTTVQKYARHVMRNLDTAGFWVDRATDSYLDTVRRKWVKGEDLRLNLYLIVAHAKRAAVREQTGRSRLTAQVVRDLREQLDTVVDVRETIRRMDDVAARILTLLSEGYSWAEVEEMTGWSVWTISKVREEFRRFLPDYEPATRPARRGRGRPRRTE